MDCQAQPTLNCLPPPPPPTLDCQPPSTAPETSVEAVGRRLQKPKSILKCDNVNDNDNHRHQKNDDEDEDEECSSDTGLSSLSTSTEEGTYALTTLV